MEWMDDLSKKEIEVKKKMDELEGEFMVEMV